MSVGTYVRTGDLFCTSVRLELLSERSETQRVSKANPAECTKGTGVHIVPGHSASTNPGNRVPQLVVLSCSGKDDIFDDSTYFRFIANQIAPYAEQLLSHLVSLKSKHRLYCQPFLDVACLAKYKLLFSSFK